MSNDKKAMREIYWTRAMMFALFACFALRVDGLDATFWIMAVAAVVNAVVAGC